MPVGDDHGGPPALHQALEAFRSQMKALRKRQGINQAEAARRAGISSDDWSRIESGKTANPGLRFVLAIHYALGSESLENFFGEEPCRRLLAGNDGEGSTSGPGQ